MTGVNSNTLRAKYTDKQVNELRHILFIEDLMKGFRYIQISSGVAEMLFDLTRSLPGNKTATEVLQLLINEYTKTHDRFILEEENETEE